MSCNVIIADRFSKEFEKFVFKLDKSTRAKLARELDLLEKRGPVLPMPYVKKIHSSIWELRIRGRQEVRVLYTVNKNNVYVLSWFVKKSQKTPMAEMNKAIKRLQER